jgi:HEAT repeat protein
MLWTVRTLLALTLLAAALPAAAKPKLKPLLEAFNEGKSADRRRLAVPLGRTRETKAVDALIIAFDPKRGDPRETAALVEGLGLSGDPRAMDHLAGAWDYMNTVTMQLGELPAHLQLVRWKILEAMARLGGSQAVTTLSTALNDADPRVVEEAVRGLARLKIRDAAPALQQLAVSADSPNLRQAVFEALGELGDRRAVSTLRQALNTPDKFVEIQAAYGLARLGDKEMLPRLQDALKTDPGAVKQGVLAGYYLVKLDRDAGLDYFAGLLKGRDFALSALAAEALGKTDNPRAALVLVEHHRHEDPQTRLSIARALSRLGGSRSFSALRKMAGDSHPGVRAAALTGLADWGESA